MVLLDEYILRITIQIAPKTYKKYFTKNFHFTKLIICICGIFVRVYDSCPSLIIVDDVSSVHRTVCC